MPFSFLLSSSVPSLVVIHISRVIGLRSRGARERERVTSGPATARGNSADGAGEKWDETLTSLVAYDVTPAAVAALPQGEREREMPIIDERYPSLRWYSVEIVIEGDRERGRQIEIDI